MTKSKILVATIKVQIAGIDEDMPADILYAEAVRLIDFQRRKVENTDDPNSIYQAIKFEVSQGNFVTEKMEVVENNVV